MFSCSKEVNLITGLEVFQVASEETTSRPEALITACYSVALFSSSTARSIRKEALSKLRNLSDASLLHLPLTVQDPVKDARLLHQVHRDHGIRATLLAARVQLTHRPHYLAAESASTDFSLLDENPLLVLNCVGSVEITKAFCNDCIAASSSKLRAPMKWSLHSSIEDHPPYILVRLI